MNSSLLTGIIIASHLTTGYGGYMAWKGVVSPHQTLPVAIVEPQKTVSGDKAVNTAPSQKQEASIGSQPKTVVQIIEEQFGPESRLALAVFKAESGLDPQAVGDANTPYPSCGVAQIRILPERRITCDEMKDINHNIEYAKYLRDRKGWNVWTSYRTGNYKRYLQ